MKKGQRTMYFKNKRGLALAAVLGVSVGGWTLGCSDDSAGTPPDTKSSPTSSSSGTPDDASTATPAASGTPAEPAEDPRTEMELIAAGRGAYSANCIACHAMDPKIDGALGPAVAGSSYELLEARVIHGTYPEGYTPKRPSRVMIPLPHLKPRLGELAAYLGSLE